VVSFYVLFRVTEAYLKLPQAGRSGRSLRNIMIVRTFPVKRNKSQHSYRQYFSSLSMTLPLRYTAA
jgi:hypothetical protein